MMSHGQAQVPRTGATSNGQAKAIEWVNERGFGKPPPATQKESGLEELNVESSERTQYVSGTMKYCGGRLWIRHIGFHGDIPRLAQREWHRGEAGRS